MRGLVVPPKTEDFTADPVELFFDLAFVFAFSQLVSYMVEHPTWAGFGEAALVFALLWIGWSQYTWSANAVSSSGRQVRSIFLLGTAVSVPMAASVTTAYGDGGPIFTISLGFIFLLALWTMTTGYERGSDQWRSSIAYGLPNGFTAVIIVAGSFLDKAPRIGFWIAALVLYVFTTIRAGKGEWVVRTGHFAERHGLITIIALGEVIVAIGIGVINALQDDEGLAASSVAALFAAAAFASILWWSYFDRSQPAFEHRFESLEGSPRAQFARDVYTYGHLPIVGGVIVSAAALEEITLHPDAPLHTEFKVMLIGGLALYFGGIALGVIRAFGVLAKERLIGTIVLAAIVSVTGDMDGWILLVLINVVLVVILIFEHLRIERPSNSEAVD